MKTSAGLATTAIFCALLCVVILPLLACQKRSGAVVLSVAEMHGVLFPYPTNWKAFKTKRNGLIFRESGRETHAWIQFEPPVSTVRALPMASRSLKDDSATKSYNNLYLRPIWLQRLKGADGERVRGVIDSSHGPIAFRGFLRTDAEKGGTSWAGLNSIIGGADAPERSVPQGVTREVLSREKED
jgi:hypothetical protein